MTAVQAIGTRERILLAAAETLSRTTLIKFALEDVAKEAQCSRQTIYNHFAGRDELVVALLVKAMQLRHAPVFVSFEQRVASPANLVRLFMAELNIGREYPLFEEMLSSSAAPRMAELIFQSQVIKETRESLWLPVLERYSAAGLLRSDLSHTDITRWITYQQFWLLTHPGTLCPDEKLVPRYVRDFVIGAIVGK